MSEYSDEVAVIKSRRLDEKSGIQLTEKQKASRRNFIRKAAIGAAATGAALAVKGGVGGSGNAAAQSGQNGNVTVDAVLLTYISSPDGSVGSSTLTLSSTFSNTLRLSAAASASLSIGTSSSFTNGAITISGGQAFNVSVSSQVTDGVTLNSTTSLQVTTPAPGQPNHTVFYGIQRPRINFQGDPTRLLFKFLGADGVFTARADSLQAGQWPFSQATVNAMLAQYPPLADPTGSTLTKPRFKKRFSFPTDAGINNVLTFSTSNGSSFSSNLTATFGATITAMDSFTDSGLTNTFSVGQTINFTLTAVQEISSTQIMSISFTLNPSVGPKVFKVYRDKVFKTYLVIAGGAPALSGQPVVQGTVYDSYGSPIPGALVTLTQGNVDYAKIADSSGNFYIATESGDALSTGVCPITSGGVSQNVNVSSGTSYAPMSGRDPGTSQSTFVQDALVY